MGVLLGAEVARIAAGLKGITELRPWFQSPARL